MSKGKMKSKEELLEQVNKYINLELVSKANQLSTLEALLDIRDILDERMPKGIEISGEIEETIK